MGCVGMANTPKRIGTLHTRTARSKESVAIEKLCVMHSCPTARKALVLASGRNKRPRFAVIQFAFSNQLTRTPGSMVAMVVLL